MAIKSISTRASICGRGSGARSGSSAVEQSSYISRQTMYNEYDGKTYYPKYSEDLVRSEVILPANAPPDYKDASVLWNAVEMNEKSANAQLARVYKFELPNEWSYELATEVVRDYMKRNFVGEEMCCQFAIHDSENPKTGQRNLHCHALLTLRGIDGNGKWMPKQKKAYLLDENGERIPLIDKKTGRQKVDKQNRKQWKCITKPTNDWSSKDNAKKWRKDLVDTINAVNKKIGQTEHKWEHRSFKEQGLDILPQIHLGEKASAMERAGIPTIRGNINREIINYNQKLSETKKELSKAQIHLSFIKSIPAKAEEVVKIVKNEATNIKNEIIDVIRRVSEKHHGLLFIPTFNAKYLAMISNRENLQKPERMEMFVNTEKLYTFKELDSFMDKHEEMYQNIAQNRIETVERINTLSEWIERYERYEPLIPIHKESTSRTGISKIIYDRQHEEELEEYSRYRQVLKDILPKDEKITPKAWRKEKALLEAKFEESQMPYAKIVTKLASGELLKHNKKTLEKTLADEQRNKELERRKIHNISDEQPQQYKKKRRDEQSL